MRPLKYADIYDGLSPNDMPAYGFAEAGRYLRIAPATLRSWVVGRSYPRSDGPAFFEPVLRLPTSKGRKLSFANLVEAHVLRALRTEHGVSIQAVRDAVGFAQDAYGIHRPLLSPELRTDAGHLFLDKYGALVNLSKSGQMAMRMVLGAYLKRIEWSPANVPMRLFPFLRGDLTDGPRIIAIDPVIAFGRPVIQRTGVSTAAIVSRIDAGETVEEIALDYDLDPREVAEAVVYEKAA